MCHVASTARFVLSVGTSALMVRGQSELTKLSWVDAPGQPWRPCVGEVVGAVGTDPPQCPTTDALGHSEQIPISYSGSAICVATVRSHSFELASHGTENR
jgi:hypothetical protein